MKSLAIIGTGIAGLGAAHFLHKRFDLTLYEQNDYPGGHSNTITVDEEGRSVPIDTGFMVFNHVTYPNLTRLFSELGVQTRPTSMSFSVQHTPSGLEYNGSSVNQLFGQRRNLVNPRHWRMLLSVNRFNREAVRALDEPRWANHAIGEYVSERGYGDDMLNRFLVPMGSAVWSTPPDKMLDFPAVTLLRFWHNHGFLGMDTQHPWYTVVNGAKSYVTKITEPFRGRIQVKNRAVRVERRGGVVRIATQSGGVREFDKVILACHADQALALLVDPTEMERRLLGAFQFQTNTATLHSDASLMPRTRRCWASWNYRIDEARDGGVVPSTHYWMNSLQGVSRRKDYFVSLNSHDRIAPGEVLKRIEYEHPLFDSAAVAAQRELPSLNQIGPEQTTYYAGAWFKYGFHEDGFTSGLDCARAVSGEAIWK
ncbi:MAG: FAD-dependent oxidoreductase [Gemmatimonadaceae bacterium]